MYIVIYHIRDETKLAQEFSIVWFCVKNQSNVYNIWP